MNDWLEPRTIVAIASPCLSILFGIWVTLWNYRQSRWASLAEILELLGSAVQELHDASKAGKLFEQLRRSFRDDPEAVTAKLNAKQFLDTYHTALESGRKHFKEAMSKFSAHSFRFPEGTVERLKKCFDLLEPIGNALIEKRFEQADDQLQQFVERFRDVKTHARGWKLTIPRWSLFKKAKKEPPAESLISEDEMNLIFDLIHHRAEPEGDNKFYVHPPELVIKDETVLDRDNVLELLGDSRFLVRFQSGRSATLRLIPFLAFVYHLIELKAIYQKMNAAPPMQDPDIQGREYTMTVQSTFSLQTLLQPGVAQRLFKRVDFAKTSFESQIDG